MDRRVSTKRILCFQQIGSSHFEKDKIMIFKDQCSNEKTEMCIAGSYEVAMNVTVNCKITEVGRRDKKLRTILSDAENERW